MARDGGSLSSLYELLADLAAAELELVRRGELGTVSQLQAERRALVARLPEHAPPDALGHLRRAAELQEQTSVAAGTGLSLTRQELSRLARGRGAVRAYTPAITHVASVDYAG
jgi:hypothetical protein